MTPWMSPGSIEFLKEALGPGTKPMHGFEWGSGSSTVWYAQRLLSIATVEHDPAWAAKLPKAPNIVVYQRPLGASYVGAIRDYTHSPVIDLVVVDGRMRVSCVSAAIPWVSPGGMLVLDDAQRPRYDRAIRQLSSGFQLVHSSRDHDSPRVTTIWRKHGAPTVLHPNT